MDGFSSLNNPRIDDAAAERELQRIHQAMSRLQTRAAEDTQLLRGSERLPSSRQLPTGLSPQVAPRTAPAPTGRGFGVLTQVGP